MTIAAYEKQFTAAPRNIAELSNQNVSSDYSRNATVIHADYQHALLDGGQPFSARHDAHSASALKDITVVLPEGFEVTRRTIAQLSASGETILAVKDLSTIMIERHANNVAIHVASAEFDEMKRVLKEVVDKIPHVKPPEDILDAWVWYLTGDGPKGSVKKLKVPKWDDIERNYVPKVHKALTELMAEERPEGTGKIILWHGDPGTGKTTALRAMAREWKEWCEFHYISDPERFFASPEYLLEVGVTPPDDDDDEDAELEEKLREMGAIDDDEEEKPKRKPNWRLVVCEDSDEFLKVNARQEAGAALGRLLNFADGILGQGSNTLILLTTNEPLAKLHPAVTRAGRCMAQVEFKHFTAAEANKWFEGRHNVSGPMALADMINTDIGEARQIKTGIEEMSHGQYL